MRTGLESHREHNWARLQGFAASTSCYAGEAAANVSHCDHFLPEGLEDSGLLIIYVTECSLADTRTIWHVGYQEGTRDRHQRSAFVTCCAAGYCQPLHNFSPQLALAFFRIPCWRFAALAEHYITGLGAVCHRQHANQRIAALLHGT